MKKPHFKVKETILSQSLAPLSEMLNPDKRRVLKFEATLIDADTIRRIAKRGAEMAATVGIGTNEMMLAMDITTVHLNVRSIKLLQLLMSGDDDFSHDVFGLVRYLNRVEGVLMNDFKLRFFGDAL